MKRKDRLRQRLLVLALLAAVIVVDQAAKWWAWRHVPAAHINPGGDLLTGPTVGSWYAQPVSGALLDLLGFGLLSIAVAVLGRRRRLAAVTVCGSLMIGGWGSNLLDRLGMHYWTAPGSLRGAVDFIKVGAHCYNLADVFIVGATPLFLLLAAACLAKRARIGPAGAVMLAARNWPRAQAPIAAVAVAGLVMTVAVGAAHNGRLIRPLHPSVKCCQPVHPTRRWAPPALVIGGSRHRAVWHRGGSGLGRWRSRPRLTRACQSLARCPEPA